MRYVTIACSQKSPNLNKHIIRLDWPDNTWPCWCKNRYNNRYGRVSTVYSSSWSLLNRRKASPVNHFLRHLERPCGSRSFSGWLQRCLHGTEELLNGWTNERWICESLFRITLHKRAHFAFSMQNRIHYFRWTAGLIVVTNSFLTGTKNDKYGNLIL